MFKEIDASLALLGADRQLRAVPARNNACLAGSGAMQGQNQLIKLFISQIKAAALFNCPMANSPGVWPKPTPKFTAGNLS